MAFRDKESYNVKDMERHMFIPVDKLPTILGSFSVSKILYSHHQITADLKTEPELFQTLYL
jgi:hypothetical protein